ncbi:MAG: hypothetical protein ACI9FU_001211, partial [Granulosicoccus sp.]
RNSVELTASGKATDSHGLPYYSLTNGIDQQTFGGEGIISINNPTAIKSAQHLAFVLAYWISFNLSLPWGKSYATSSY